MTRETRVLLAAMISELESVSKEQDNPLLRHTESIRIISEKISDLKVFIETTSFDTKEQEIEFFKILKPQFDGRLIFFTKLLNIDQHLPRVSRRDQKDYYRHVARQIQHFYKRNHEFVMYCRLEATHLDDYYFRRSRNISDLVGEDLYLFYDQQYHARMSCKMARLVACDMLQSEIATRLNQMQSAGFITQNKEEAPPAELNWTASVTAMVELIYALEEYGVFNNTKVGIKKIATYFSRIFNIPLTNIYKIYENSRLRKKSRTPFLDALRSSLLRRMEHDDEFAL